MGCVMGPVPSWMKGVLAGDRSNVVRIDLTKGFDLCAECGRIGQGFVVKQRETWSPEVGDHLVEQSLCGDCQELGV